MKAEGELETTVRSGSISQVKFDGEEVNHTYFLQYLGGIMNAGRDDDPETKLYKRCTESYDWLKTSAKRSREGHHEVSVFGFNGSSHLFYEHAIVQLAEWAQLYGLSRMGKLNNKDEIVGHNVGYILTSPEAKGNFVDFSKSTLVRILDKLDVVKHNVDKQEGEKLAYWKNQ